MEELVLAARLINEERNACKFEAQNFPKAAQGRWGKKGRRICACVSFGKGLWLLGLLGGQPNSRKLGVTLSIEGANKSVTRRISPGKHTEGFSPFLVQEDQWKCSSAAERVSGHRITAPTGTDKDVLVTSTSSSAAVPVPEGNCHPQTQHSYDKLHHVFQWLVSS